MIHACSSRAGIAQLVEQLICNQQVGGSSPSTSSIFPRWEANREAEQQTNMGEFPSGQRGQTVNLLALPSVVRIHLPPPIPDVKTFGISALRGELTVIRSISCGQMFLPGYSASAVVVDKGIINLFD